MFFCLLGTVKPEEITLHFKKKPDNALFSTLALS